MFDFSRRQVGQASPRRSAFSLQLEALEARTTMSASPNGDGHDDDTVEFASASSDNTVHDIAAYASSVDGAGDTTKKAANLKALNGEKVVGDSVGAGDVDFYKFSLAKNGDLDLKLSGLSADANVQILNSKGIVVAQSNNAGTLDEALSLQLSKGTYYAVVSAAGDATTHYTLNIASHLDLAGSTRKTAANLGKLGGSVISTDGRIGGVDTNDYYKVAITKESYVKFELSELTSHSDIYLYDKKGNLLAQSTQTEGGEEDLVRYLPKGTYYINVVPVGANARGAYHLDVAYTTAPNTTGGSGSPTTPTNPSAPSTPTTPNPDAPLPSQPYYGGVNDANLNAINAPDSWAAGYTGKGVIVAVLDGGIDYNHSEFAGRLWVNTGEIAGDGIDNDGNGFVDDVRGWDFAGHDNDPLGTGSHGTHVAGLLAGARDGVGVTGVAYDAIIMNVQVLSANNTGWSDEIAAGIRYAVDNGAQIINMSLNSGGNTQDVRSAIAYAEAHNVLIVAASGNNSAGTPDWPAQFSATFSNVISVGAHNNSNARSSYSNKVGGSGAIQVDAPGDSVYSSTPRGGYGNMSGTSMATPQVAGLAALMLSANGNLTASDLRTLIAATADRKISGSDSIGGINVGAAVAAALNPTAYLGNSSTTSGAGSSASDGTSQATAASVSPIISDDFSVATETKQAMVAAKAVAVGDPATAVESIFSNWTSERREGVSVARHAAHEIADRLGDAIAANVSGLELAFEAFALHG